MQFKYQLKKTALSLSLALFLIAPVFGGPGADLWAIRPISHPAIPVVKNRAWIRNPIDAFVLAELENRGMRPAPPADRVTLIRRATFDLLGLPPTPDEIDAFVRDKNPHAYEKLIDRLLASPHYGERWARHWLDVARFAESQGFEYDRIRENAWRYRDYVIDSLNADKPYDLFVREQVAGDALPGSGSAGVAATGFLVAGPSDEAAKISPSPAVRGRAREEELEDMVGLIGQTFIGLTVNCARCHDHKFDPITQRDYYRLKAALEGVRSGERPALSPDQLAKRDAERLRYGKESAQVREDLRTLEAPAREQILKFRGVASSASAPAPIARWTFDVDGRDSIGSLDGVFVNGAKVANGRLQLAGNSLVRTPPLKQELREKTLEAWLVLPDLDQHGGSAITIEVEGGGQFDGIVYGERQRRKWIAGSEGFQRTKDLDAVDEASGPGDLVHVAVVYSADNRITVYRNGQPYAESYLPAGASGSLRTYPAGRSHILFGLRHSGAQDYLHGEIEEARLYGRALTPQEVRDSFENTPFRVTESEIENGLSIADRSRRKDLVTRLERLSQNITALESPPQVYAVVSSKPEPTHILLRGDLEKKGDLVTAGGVASLRGCRADFGVTNEVAESERRVKLADWLTDRGNPLTARVAVNRVWHYHFGRGIVGTPNDFGVNGERPTNPALLDWLASVFASPASPQVVQTASGVQSAPSPKGKGDVAASVSGGLGWSLKRLHRLIMLSSAYRQSSRYDAKAAAVDAEDKFLWRFAPRRLEGEAVRDAMLSVSGQLNPVMGGPGFRPFTVSNFNSDFYTLTDPIGPEFNRRTIYRIGVHSAKSPLLDSLDCPDPSTKTPRRTVTTTPLQALELMNNSFVLRQSHLMAERISKNGTGDASAQVGVAYRLAFGRQPTAAELQRGSTLVTQHGLDALCWTMLNATEFMYVR